LLLFSSFTPPPPNSTLFPYTTLFRSLPDALPTDTGIINRDATPTDTGKFDSGVVAPDAAADGGVIVPDAGGVTFPLTVTVQGDRSEEHTSELQSRGHLVCRLLLEKKK